MKSLIKALIFLSSFSGLGQTYQTVVEMHEACGQLGFMSNQEAEIIVDKILQEFGLDRTFVIQECPGINNAIAKIIQVSPNYQERYILFDGQFFDRINDKAKTDWAAWSILAHEIGHHLNGHSLDKFGSTHAYELSADRFSGTAMGLLGATLKEAQSAISTFVYEKATSTHPAKADRLAAIEQGWLVAKNKRKSEKSQIVREVVEVEKGNNIEIYALNKSKRDAFWKKASKAHDLKQFSSAADYAFKAYQYSAGDLGFLNFAASSLVAANRIDEALRYFLFIVKKGYRGRNAEQINSTNLMIGLIYDYKNMVDDAIKFYEMVLLDNPTDMDLNANLSSQYLKKGNVEKAREFARRATQGTPKKSYTAYNLGTAFHKLGDFKNAQKYLLKAIQMNPAEHNAYLNLSSSYLGEANSIIDQLNRIPDTPNTQREYDKLLAQKDLLIQKGIKILEQGIRALPNAPGLKNRLRTVKSRLNMQ